MTRKNELSAEDIAARIRVARAKANIGQKELAVKAGIAPCTLNFIENGKRAVRMTTISKLADALDVSVEELIGKKRSKPKRKK